MIKTFKHKGLRKFFESGETKLLDPDHLKKIRLMLARLNTACDIKDMNAPGYRLHEHKGEGKGTWSIDVSGNYRITFRFENSDVYDVDYLDVH